MVTPAKSQSRRDARRVSAAIISTTVSTSTTGALPPRSGRSRCGTTTKSATTGITRRCCGDRRRTPRSASRCWRARARQAFLEHYPVTMARGADARIYRSIPFGPLVEVFALDMRSYRGAEQREPADGGERRDRVPRCARRSRWLADALTRSTATWKIVAADMPLGLVVGASTRTSRSGRQRRRRRRRSAASSRSPACCRR